MVAMYNIAGRQVGSHVLAMLTLGALGGLSATFMGGSAAKKTQGPPINAQSPDEESFIKDFLKNAEADEKKGNNVDATKKDAGR
ncbi:Protein of unknown function (DUF2611) domain containing protein [Hyaloscypha variabilis]|uniref:ATP synthase subunit K, mitochondrial n=1 Tax=Hyaloscypha variabilis (strain UAMH 11265 / GT02V1 / F) TaxID=1149755 RepID=A0A2J6RBJ9_HYAVF|nr:hypothetical protein L207DRAFT_586926 [Hyaloscypha variabilis F]